MLLAFAIATTFATATRPHQDLQASQNGSRPNPGKRGFKRKCWKSAVVSLFYGPLSIIRNNVVAQMLLI